MKAILERAPVYALTVGDIRFSDLRQVSEWEGFRKLEGPLGVIIICADTTKWSELFADIFSDKDSPGGAFIVKASPAVWAELNRKPAANA